MNKKVDHPFRQSNMSLPAKIIFSLLRLIFKLFGKISPKLAGILALRTFMTPTRVTPPKREQAIRQQAKQSFKTIKDKKIAIYTWGEDENGDDAPTILLSHGWAGRSSQFLEVIKPLIDQGYRLIGFDVPAHGDSSSKHTNMIETAQVISQIGEEFSSTEKPLTALIGHSFGTGTALLAMDKYGLKADKVILIGAFSRIKFITDMFSDLFSLSKETRDAMLNHALEKFSTCYGISWDWNNIAPIETIKSVSSDILFIHDDTDYEVPITEVEALHHSRPDAQILITSGLGHRRILRDDQVVNTMLRFIQQG